MPDNSAAQNDLTTKLAHLALAPQSGHLSSPQAAALSDKTFTFAANEQGVEAIRLHFGEAQDQCILQVEGVEYPIACGHGTWLQSPAAPMDTWRVGKVAASGAWTADDIYAMKLCFYETPFIATVVCRVDEETLLYNSAVNVSFGPTTRPQLQGEQLI